MARSSADVERLFDEIAELKKKVSSLLEPESGPAADGGKAATNAAADVLDGAGDAVRAVRDTVREHPIVSVAGAFAIGYSLARLLRR